MEKEMKLLCERDTWDLIERPRGKPVKRGLWVFAEKMNAKGEVIKKKAQFCLDGRGQTYGINFSDTYTPVVCFESLRVNLAIAAIHDTDIH
jgi:hypothetical protein